MFNVGDTVRFKSSNLSYTLESIEGDQARVTRTADSAHKVTKIVNVDRLVKVEINDPFEFPAQVVPEVSEKSSTQKSADTANVVIRDEVPVHIPGESPAEYKARTGHKLDGRRTSYGHAVLAALQPKFRSFGVKTRRGRKVARNANGRKAQLDGNLGTR